MGAIRFIICFLGLLATSSFAFDYTNKELGFTATLPDGLDDLSSQTRVKTLISRGTLDGSKDRAVLMVCLQDLNATIGREDISKLKNKPKNTTLEKMAWKSFEIDVFRCVEDLQGVAFLTFNAQVPLKPHAIQVRVCGPEYDESKLRKDLQNVVASVDGPTNWLTAEEVRRRQPLNAVAIIIGLFAVLFGKFRITRHYGLEGTGARVAGFAIVAFGVALPKLFPYVIPPLRDYGLDAPTVVLILIAMQFVIVWGIIAITIHHYGNPYATDEAAAKPEKPRKTHKPSQPWNQP